MKAHSLNFIDATVETNSRPTPSFRAKVIGWCWACILRALCASWRKRYEGFELIDQKKAEGRKMMLCFWHGKYLPIFALCRWLWIDVRGQSACVFTSRSARGEVISEICRHFGLDCIQIPDGGRKTSYAMMRQALLEHTSGVIALDGPLGPYRRVKQGAIKLASELDYWLVPASVGARRKTVLENRWDRMEIPAPFTQIGLSMGQPKRVPPNISRKQVRELMDQLFETLGALEYKAENLVNR